ncbi:MAG TPA: hypothetical protein VLO07_08345, partial [Thermoanaerobaculia bacterium]|nr:hypothetical protein [Thermoanaerobaculia bacterium]
MERLERRDARFILICLAVILAGAGVTAVLFRRAFPEAWIEFRVGRQEARARAEKFLAERGKRITDRRFAGRFGVEEEPKVYLERELGLERASVFYGRDAKVWRWEMRWFRSSVKEEERVAVTPLGDLVSYESVLRDDAPGPRLTRPEARALAVRFLALRGLSDSALSPIEATPLSRPNRTDWTFVDERRNFRMGEATVRYETTVSGGEVTGFQELIHVPESWSRDYERLRSKNETANVVGNLGLILTFLAMLGVLVTKIVRKDVRWGLVGGFGGVTFLLSLLSIVNDLPLALYAYDSASPLSAHLANQILFGVLRALGWGAGIAIVIAAAEPIYRERFPRHLSLSGLFSKRGLRSKRLFRGVLLGYAMTAFFFAYQAIFYVVAARLGAWAPAEINYDNILNTAIPWVTVLFIGFLPAVLEEGSSRLFSISFLDKLGAGRFVAVVLPAAIWGFNHAAYPNQPFYIRGVEVGFAGILIGLVMLRAGALPLLVWHFTVDALYTALLLLRSHNLYYAVSGGVAAFILLLPLAAAVFLYLRRGGFESEEGLTNGDEGFAPPRAVAEPLVAEKAVAVSPVRRRVLGRLAAVAILLASAFLLPVSPADRLAEDHTGRPQAELLARSFLSANGVSVQGLRSFVYLGTGFTNDEDLRQSEPEEWGGIPGFSDGSARYVLSQGGLSALERLAQDRLPLAYWVVRFFQPEKKEEWKVLVDARRGRVVGFVHPVEETAAAAPAPAAGVARRRALDAAARLGYPSASYSVVDLGTKVRPQRTDTSVVLESRPVGLGETRVRLTAVFHGPLLSCFLPSVRVPEDFLRDYRKRLVSDRVLLAVKIVAMGSIVGAGFILFLRIVRRAEFRWKTQLRPMLVVGFVGAAAFANSTPSLLRRYPTETPWLLFSIRIGTLLFIAWLVVLCGALIGFVVISGARPGWGRVLRAAPLGDGVARVAVAVLGLAGLARWERWAAARFPVQFGFDPSLPPSLEHVLPGFTVFWSAARGSFLAAAVAATVALAANTAVFRKPAGRLLALGLVLVACAPTTLRSFGESMAAFVPAFLTLAWIAVAAF